MANDLRVDHSVRVYESNVVAELMTEYKLFGFAQNSNLNHCVGLRKMSSTFVWMSFRTSDDCSNGFLHQCVFLGPYRNPF